MNKFLVCTKQEEEDIKMYLFGPYQGEEVDGIAFLSSMEEANMTHENKIYCQNDLINLIVQHNITELQEDDFLLDLENKAIPSLDLINRLDVNLQR